MVLQVCDLLHVPIISVLGHGLVARVKTLPAALAAAHGDARGWRRFLLGGVDLGLPVLSPPRCQGKP